MYIHARLHGLEEAHEPSSPIVNSNSKSLACTHVNYIYMYIHIHILCVCVRDKVCMGFAYYMRFV